MNEIWMDIVLFATDIKQSEYIVANKDPTVLMLFRCSHVWLLCSDFIIIDVEPNPISADIGINDRIYIEFLLTFFLLQSHYIYFQCNLSSILFTSDINCSISNKWYIRASWCDCPWIWPLLWFHFATDVRIIHILYLLEPLIMLQLLMHQISYFR